MIVVLLADGKAMHVQASPFVHTQPKADGLYSLEALYLNIEEADPKNVLILPDNAQIEEGDEITDELRAMAVSFSDLERATREQAQAEALGLMMRASVADGSITDDTLFRIAPAFIDREWRPGLAVEVGDVYCHDGLLFRCVQAHTTQEDWRPGKLLALWRCVQPDAAVKLWQLSTDYEAGDIVGYPDEATLYACVQGHTSQEGWEPPNIPALWEAR